VCVCVCVVVCVFALCVCVLCVCVLNNQIRGYIRLQTFNCVASCKHKTHSREQAQKRGITDSDIKRAKAESKMSLSIHLNGEEDKNEAKDSSTWGDEGV
jgi:hypothetical protein